RVSRQRGPLRCVYRHGPVANISATRRSAYPPPERCPSGLRSTLGKRVYAKRTGGSNPPLSATVVPPPPRPLHRLLPPPSSLLPGPPVHSNSVTPEPGLHWGRAGHDRKSGKDRLPLSAGPPLPRLSD